MATYEYERKFLVSDPEILRGAPCTRIWQGYLAAANGFSVRVRYSPDPDPATKAIPADDPDWPVTDYTLTVKGPRVGIQRREEEFCIPPEAAEVLVDACGSAQIIKDRYPIAGPDGNMWTVDVFLGLNKGLVLAELEQQSPGAFVMPTWCGADVTTDPRYYNDYLSAHPFSTWPENRDDEVAAPDEDEDDVD